MPSAAKCGCARAALVLDTTAHRLRTEAIEAIDDLLGGGLEEADLNMRGLAKKLLDKVHADVKAEKTAAEADARRRKEEEAAAAKAEKEAQKAINEANAAIAKAKTKEEAEARTRAKAAADAQAKVEGEEARQRRQAEKEVAKAEKEAAKAETAAKRKAEAEAAKAEAERQKAEAAEIARKEAEAEIARAMDRVMEKAKEPNGGDGGGGDGGGSSSARGTASTTAQARLERAQSRFAGLRRRSEAAPEREAPEERRASKYSLFSGGGGGSGGGAPAVVSDAKAGGSAGGAPELVSQSAAKAAAAWVQPWREGGVRSGEMGAVVSVSTDCLCCDDDSDTLLSIGGDGDPTSVSLYSAKRGSVLQSYLGHTDKVCCVALQGDCVASGGRDKTIRLWSRKSGAPLALGGWNRMSPGGRGTLLRRPPEALAMRAR
jgi:hypothetical protein